MGSSGQGAMGVFWAWVEGATGNIALALGSLVEQVRSWVSAVGLKGLGLPSSMDTLNTLLVGWMLFVTLILILGSFFYFKFIHQLDNESESLSEDSGPKREPREKGEVTQGGGGRTGQGKTVPSKPPAEPARTPTIVPRQPPTAVSPPVATGADPDAVNFANNVFTWLYNSAESGKIIKKLWLDTVNENTFKTAIDTGIQVELLEVLSATPAPSLSNVVVDCSPSDNVTITCDCDATVYLRLMTTRTQGETTTESEYACAIQPLRGRLNIAALTADLMAVVKFDGWPEVSIELEGIRNNAKGLDEQSMMDVIREVVTSAVRNSVFDVNFKPVPTFPKFRRARQQPDKIIPIGYDSMVRELQTHPPPPKKIPLRPAPPPPPIPAAKPVEEVRVKTRESFTALSFANAHGLASGLTTSEEQLIARNLNKYPSLENTDLAPDEIADLCKTWQDNYIPTSEVPATSEPEEEVPKLQPHMEHKDDAAGLNFVLVASNRSKMIDEPRRILPFEERQYLEDDLEEDLEEDPELAALPLTSKPHDEPLIRRQIGSPLLLAARKLNDSTLHKDDDQEPEAVTLEQMAKSLGVMEAAPRPGILRKDPPVSEAWCDGVAARNLQLDPRPAGGVACDLECTQEDPSTHPTLSPAHPQREPPFQSLTPLLDSFACGLPVESVDEPSDQSSSCTGDERKDLGNSHLANQTCSLTSNQDEDGLECRGWNKLNTTIQSSDPEVLQFKQVVKEAQISSSSSQTIGELSVIIGEDQGKTQRPIESFLDDQNIISVTGDPIEQLDFCQDHFRVGSDAEEYTCVKESVTDVNINVKRDSSFPDKNMEKSGFEMSKVLSSGSQEDISVTTSETKALQASKITCSISDKESELDCVGENDSNEDQSSVSQGSDSSRHRKLCLNEFTDNLFSRIELEDSEIALPEEFTEEAAWEVTEVYEAENGRRRKDDVSDHSFQSDDDTRISDSVFGKLEDGSLTSESSSYKPDTTSSDSHFTSSSVSHFPSSSGSHFTSSLTEDKSSDSKELGSESVVSASLKILPSDCNIKENLLDICSSEQDKTVCQNSGRSKPGSNNEDDRQTTNSKKKQNDPEDPESINIKIDDADNLGAQNLEHLAATPSNIKDTQEVSICHQEVLSHVEVCPTNTALTNTHHQEMNGKKECSSIEHDASLTKDLMSSKIKNESSRHVEQLEHDYDSSSTDSEVEGITGKMEKERAQQKSSLKTQWRKSDIEQLAEAELTDTDLSPSVKGLLEIDIKSNQFKVIKSSVAYKETSDNIAGKIQASQDSIGISSQDDIQTSIKDYCVNPSQMNVQNSFQDILHTSSQKNMPVSAQDSIKEPSQIDVNILTQDSINHSSQINAHQNSNTEASQSEGSKGREIDVMGSSERRSQLTPKNNKSSVATLTPTDHPDPLTPPHVAKHHHATPTGASHTTEREGDANTDPLTLPHTTTQTYKTPMNTTHTLPTKAGVAASFEQLSMHKHKNPTIATLTNSKGDAYSDKPGPPDTTTHKPPMPNTITEGDASYHNYYHDTTPGGYYWSRPPSSYPVYGTYYVTSSSLPPASSAQPSLGIPGLNGKRLLVKIVKATGVGCEKKVNDAYAVVEMDEPPQKFTTSVAKDTNSPFWDEQFLFDLSGGTLELLFELYDRSDGNFLGLGIVGIEELVATPSQRQIIPLQSRPYENDQVSGSLTVEFLFLDRAEVPEHTVRMSATSQSVTPRGALVTTTTTTYVKANEGQDDDAASVVDPVARTEDVNPDIIVNGGDGVAAAVLRDIEERKVVVVDNNASKSTMIIHASRKPEDEGLVDMTSLMTTGGPTTTTAGRTSTTSPHHSASGTSTTTTPATENADLTETNGTDERGRSRGVRRKRDSFFGTLKKRFSRSKVRSKSMEPGRDPSAERDQSIGRSISMERTANINRASGLLSVPPGVGGGGGGDGGGSTRSSLSDASAISGSSTRTYVNEASTLIVETSENGVFKHYLIPLSLQQKSKWRKKGTKLHIYGEHTFVAKHMSSSTQCEVCQKSLGRRLGKQGYSCRDCGYRCHKPCHVKTETPCPQSTVNTMDLEYVKDVREERRAWVKKNKTTT